MCTCSFLLYFSSLGSSSWSFEAPLDTLTYVFFQVDFYIFSFFLNPPLNLQQPNIVFGRFDGAHHHQLVFLLCDGFHEISKIRNLPRLCSQLGGMEGNKNNEQSGPSLESMAKTSFSSFFLIPHYFNSKIRALNLETQSCNDSKLLGLKEISSFSI